MSIYARKNFIINPSGPNVLLTQPLTNGAVLVFDAALGSFVNQSLSDLITGANLGTGETVFENKVGNEFQFNTLVAGSNMTITESAGQLIFSSGTLSPAAVQIVPDIATRNAISGTLGAGAQVYVSADVDGEGALYLWDGSVYKLLATADSAAADAKTYSVILNAASPSEIVLGNISPGHRINLVSVNVLTPFNGADPTVTIGDDINGTDIHMAADLNDLSIAGKYISESVHVYTGTADTNIKVYYDADSSTIGQAQIVVTFA